ncbi:cytochrome c oxidase subunit 1 [Natronoarchaeum philippinense]|uniref:Cytochrome c oxidase subunit 1 n=1 Tax=Natronoarchaeum philippinense TaxID=558529 RepID=A0A285MZC0_NATPI|nr:cbb3-type cytochrome c oxidase subunit I [Natronoarchaeum philippinense]SNZ02542.1 cytochrome c oxidase subunit 1 [Natronoarchaeum philippinense]
MFDSVSGLVIAGCVLSALAGARFLGERLGGGRGAGADRAQRDGKTAADGGYGSPVIGLTAHGKPTGILRWLTTVDHKDIGVLYILFGTLAGLWGSTDGMMIRTELLTPESTVWTTETYNAIFTTHGFTMLFFFVTPVFFGIANYFLPLFLGADDLAFPRINAIAFWLLPPSLAMVRGGLLTDLLGRMLAPLPIDAAALFALEPIATGWTLYTPLSVQMANPQVTVALLGLHLSGVATTMGAINFIVTVFTERSEDVGWNRLDIFSWNILVTSGIILFAFPLLGSALLMLLADRSFGTTFFVEPGGGPLLWQHLFWFFGHPEVYILVLPAFGIISLVLPKFAGRRLFGFQFIVYSTIAIGVLSFGVWAHHMFATGMSPGLRASFMAVSLAIAIPSAVKEFNWIATLWNGRIRLTAPMLCLIGSLSTFVIGGITGVFLASIPVDLVLHDTYHVVGHFHFIVVGIIPLAMMAASYYWFPILTGRMYNRRLAKVQVLLIIVGTFVTFMPMLLLGYEGLPRRYGFYPPEFTPLQQIASIGAYTLGVGVVLWVINMVQSARVGPVVRDADVWNLKETGQFTREWQWFEKRLEEAEQQEADGRRDAVGGDSASRSGIQEEDGDQEGDR